MRIVRVITVPWFSFYIRQRIKFLTRRGEIVTVALLTGKLTWHGERSEYDGYLSYRTCNETRNWAMNRRRADSLGDKARRHWRHGD